MYGKEKTGLRRLWDYKIVFVAAILALTASLGQLVSAYLFYLPGVAQMKPFTFIMYTVIRWMLLSLPAYLLSAYLQDHYHTAEGGRFLATPFASAGIVAVLILLNAKGYFQGFLAPAPEALAYSIAMTLLLLLPVLCGVCQLKSWKPLPIWILAGLCACAMTALAVFSLLSAKLSDFAMALSYVVLCIAYSLAMPKILTDSPVLEDEDDTPPEEAIMKDE